MNTDLLSVFYTTEEMRAVFSDHNRVQKWLDVEAALAQALATVGLIPTSAAAEIASKARAENLDFDAIREHTARTGQVVMGVIFELERVCDRSAGQYIHWGATSQDIVDSGLVLQLKQAVSILFRDLLRLEHTFVDLADRHRKTIMPGRTHGQHALPMTFGFKAAVWAREVKRHRMRFEQMRPRLLVGSLAGGVGTLAPFGDHADEIKRLMMKQLGLGFSDIAWHTARDHLAELAALLGMVTATAAKVCREVANLMRTEVGELAEPFERGRLGGSTIPQTRNPILCETVIAIERLARARVAIAFEAMMQEHERDFGTWLAEWSTIPELCILSARALDLCNHVMRYLVVKPDRMRANLALSGDMILAEAIMFELAERMGRQRSYEVIYELCMQAVDAGVPLKQVLLGDPDVRTHITPDEIEQILDPRRYIDSATRCVERVIKRARKDWLLYGRTVEEYEARWQAALDEP